MADKELKGALAISTGAILVAAWNASRQGKSGLPQAVMDLLIAGVQHLKNIDEGIQALLARNPGGSGGILTNADSFIAFRVQCQVAGVAYQLPDYPIPDGFQLALKGWPGNANLIYIGPTEASAVSINQIFPLLPNEPLNLQVSNASAVWFSGLNAGDWVVCVVEQRKG
jgi:hypothetical protein